jgi:hypothetical protein
MRVGEENMPPCPRTLEVVGKVVALHERFVTETGDNSPDCRVCA